MADKTNLTVRIADEVDRAMRIAAAKAGVSIGAMIEEALRQHPKVRSELRNGKGRD